MSEQNGIVFIGPAGSIPLGQTEGRPLFGNAEGVTHGLKLGAITECGLKPREGV